MVVIRTPYYQWENFKNGMYKTLSEIDNYPDLYEKAKEVLSNQQLFYKIGIDMINDWNVSCDNFLTNRHINRLAFVGQACCCYKYKVPEIITKYVWTDLDFNTKNSANETAKKIVKEYEAKHRRLHSKMEALRI